MRVLPKWIQCWDGQISYREFAIPKANGRRTINVPNDKLMTLQHRILAEILHDAPVHDAAHAYVEGRSTVSNAAVHVGARIVLTTDIRDFFPSIDLDMVRRLFLKLGYGYHDAETLAKLVTSHDSLPQGAPTSPKISNVICYSMDAALVSCANDLDCKYTRFADDIAWSVHDDSGKVVTKPEHIFAIITDALFCNEFVENEGKRRIMRRNERQIVTGIVVNEKVNLPREQRKLSRAVQHHGGPEAAGWEGYEAMVRGRKP